MSQDDDFLHLPRPGCLFTCLVCAAAKSMFFNFTMSLHCDATSNNTARNGAKTKTHLCSKLGKRDQVIYILRPAESLSGESQIILLNVMLLPIKRTMAEIMMLDGKFEVKVECINFYAWHKGHLST
jgi:hypothetical protein